MKKILVIILLLLCLFIAGCEKDSYYQNMENKNFNDEKVIKLDDRMINDRYIIRYNLNYIPRARLWVSFDYLEEYDAFLCLDYSNNDFESFYMKYFYGVELINDEETAKELLRNIDKHNCLFFRTILSDCKEYCIYFCGDRIVTTVDKCDNKKFYVSINSVDFQYNDLIGELKLPFEKNVEKYGIVLNELRVLSKIDIRDAMKNVSKQEDFYYDFDAIEYESMAIQNYSYYDFESTPAGPLDMVLVLKENNLENLINVIDYLNTREDVLDVENNFHLQEDDIFPPYASTFYRISKE